MNVFHNILVIIEPKNFRQPALERGLALYNYAKTHAEHLGQTDKKKDFLLLVKIAFQLQVLTSLLYIP